MLVMVQYKAGIVFTGIDPFPEMLKGENLAGIDKYVHRPEAKD